MRTVYLVSTFWRGTLNIGDMRVFEDYTAAWTYFDSLNVSDIFKRFYEFAPGAPPKNIQSHKR